MDEFDKALGYIFIISVILVFLAYYAGAAKLIPAVAGSVKDLMLTATGRTSTGQFANYPTGG